MPQLRNPCMEPEVRQSPVFVDGMEEDFETRNSRRRARPEKVARKRSRRDSNPGPTGAPTAAGHDHAVQR